MDIRGLRYFVTVAELGSFTKAAAHLNVAQPALSRQVKQLEDEFGLELLSRRGRRIALTEAGEVLVRHARTVQRDFERLIEDMRARKATPAGRVVFGVPPALSDIVVPPVVGRVAAEFPAITIRVTEGISPVLAQWLQENQIDLAVLGLLADPAEGLRVEVLALEDMVVVEKANGVAVPAVYSLAMLERKPLVLARQFGELVRSQLDRPDLSLDVHLEVDSVQALKAMVLEGQAATILPISLLRRELRDGMVTASAITEHGVRRQLSLARPGFRQSTQATDAVARIIREEIERRQARGLFSWSPPEIGARPRPAPGRAIAGRAARRVVA